MKKFWQIYKVVQLLSPQDREVLLQDVRQRLQEKHSKDDSRANRRESQASTSQQSK